MTKNLNESLKARLKRYRDAERFVWGIRKGLSNLKKCSGRSSEFKLLEHAVAAFENQLRADFYRFKRLSGLEESRQNEIDLQQALNRERKLRAELEEKVKEATESSGLFVSYVRKKLNL